ncbi:MAG: cupin domain-containing protein [Actinomycetota bacterium]|nr:cupin domain-containing protein [Actinomycetota bacterium]
MGDGARRWSLGELREHHAAHRRAYDEVLRVEALSAGLYRLGVGASDQQAPHQEDEVYVVLAGRGSIDLEGDRARVSPGTVVYVPKGMQHRFVDITEDLDVLVVFAPPESG